MESNLYIAGKMDTDSLTAMVTQPECALEMVQNITTKYRKRPAFGTNVYVPIRHPGEALVSEI